MESLQGDGATKLDWHNNKRPLFTYHLEKMEKWTPVKRCPVKREFSLCKNKYCNRKSEHFLIELYEEYHESPVEGRMNVPTAKSQTLGEPDFNTLDEPISETILRDLGAVGAKFKHVLYPTEKKSLLKEWDLWGPLLLCTFMAMVLQGDSSPSDQSDGGPEFAEVFVIVWIGAMVVTLNSKLLGGKISFFQSVCVLGYCLLPTVIALIICRVILLAEQTNFLFMLRFIVTMSGFAWATFASTLFLGDSQPVGRKGLAVYPIFLFYFVISWLVLSHTVD